MSSSSGYQIVLATATTITCALLPRRPPDSHPGKVIDRQYAVSLLERISFSWAGPVMGSIISNPDIGDDQLPRLHHTTQSATLEERFLMFASHMSLAVTLARMHLYAKVQMKLMALRDRRTATTTEFLHGIQQIKLSALEDHWKNAIAQARNLELGSQWVVFLWETGLIFIWVLAPVMLSAVSLATYALTHTSLPPSIAFTALAVLGELEIWTALLPILSVQLLQSKASNPWIEAGTLRENILFGLPYNEGRYQQVLSACALLPDLKALPDSDRTKLGSNRVNLSGGQKIRVALARALYSRADILVLDDILGGVDVDTRYYLVYFALMGDLVRGRTRILVTHHSDDCLHFADRVYRVENGHVYEEDKQQLLKVVGKTTREHPNSQPQPEQGTHEHDIRSAEEEAAAADEQRSSEAFKFGALGRFVHAGTGIILITMIVVTSGAYLALFLGRGLWIASWTRAAQRRPTKLDLVVNTDLQHEPDQLHDTTMFHLQVYLAVSLGMCLVSTVRYFVLLKANINASRYLFDRMLAAVISLPLGWFDTVPIGRIMNRFTADFQPVDSNLGKNLGSATYGVLQIFAIILAATLALPVMLLPALILLATSVAVCYRFRLNIIGAVFATLAALLIVRARNLDASVAGFALSFVLQFTASTDFALRRYASLELDMNALERVLEFTQVETETEGGGTVPAAWPTQGLIQVCNITPGQRVGIVGRTGAGKSSLILALFRLLHLSTGSILIDDVDISTIDPRILGSRLAIVPQDPMLFSGTIRYNLDPDDQFNDSELLDLLRRVWQTTSRQDDDSLSFHTPIPSLDTPVDRGGSNFSQGERQLLHLVRALIRRPKVLVLDEATSALDFHTDEHIWRILHPEYIRRYLGGLEMSVLVVAHRLRTVVDFDQVVVLQDGQ
ncbi:hypothetical protein CEP52_006544 [Fusarium oligoseptatum]|uniref:ABC transporter n=1 Tax=Fusarium oligoseptatum TaxID=2604345 RepID=A0A428TSN0_9HYPO|nr:hypothetical protein CEP52_006544 [Fusarium oligoseptatum]